MKIAILGAGALGCYYGARLQEAGNDVAYIVRSEYDYLKEHGLEVKSINGDIQLPHIKVYTNADQVGPVDLILVALKSTANDQLTKAIPPMMGPNTIVATLQNGMGNAEKLAEIIPAEKIYVGLCFICAMRDEPGHIKHLEGGNIQFAPFIPSPQGSQQAQELATLFKQAHVPAKGFDIAEQIQWYKLVWNIPFNGLCLALGGISIAELYKRPDQVQRAKAIMEEVVASAAARGYKLPTDLVSFHLERTEKMGEFIPSSAVDYNEGRPIEYHAIWEAPLAKARQAGASIPNWEQLDLDIRQRIQIK